MEKIVKEFFKQIFNYMIIGYSFVFARPIFYNFNKVLFHFALSGMGILNYKNRYVSGELNFLKSYIKRDIKYICIDVGANVGDYTKMILKTSENCHFMHLNLIHKPMGF